MIDDEILPYFRTDDNGTTLVLCDKRGFERGFKLVPLAKPIVADSDGRAMYLTQGHIDTLLDYEREKTFEQIIDSFSFDIDYFKRISGKENK